MVVRNENGTIVIEVKKSCCFIPSTMNMGQEYPGVETIVGIDARTKRWGVYCFLLAPRQAHLELGQGGMKIIVPHTRQLWEILVDARWRFHILHLHLKKVR